MHAFYTGAYMHISIKYFYSYLPKVCALNIAEAREKEGEVERPLDEVIVLDEDRHRGRVVLLE